MQPLRRRVLGCRGDGTIGKKIRSEDARSVLCIFDASARSEGWDQRSGGEKRTENGTNIGDVTCGVEHDEHLWCIE